MSEKFIVQTSTPERLFVKVYRDFLNSKILSGKEQIVFIHLKQYIGIGNDNGIVKGEAYPTLATLAENVKMTEKTVREILKKLQRVGVLEIKRQGLNKPNIYTIKDSAEIWGATTEEERQAAISDLEIKKKIADLRALGFIVQDPKTESIKPKRKTKKSKNAFNNFEQSETLVDDDFENQILSN